MTFFFALAILLCVVGLLSLLCAVVNLIEPDLPPWATVAFAVGGISALVTGLCMAG